MVNSTYNKYIKHTRLRLEDYIDLISNEDTYTVRLAYPLTITEVCWLKANNYTFKIDDAADALVDPSDGFYYDHNGDLLSYNYIIIKRELYP